MYLFFHRALCRPAQAASTGGSMEQPLAPCGGQVPVQSVSLTLTPVCFARTCPAQQHKGFQRDRNKTTLLGIQNQRLSSCWNPVPTFCLSVLLPGKLFSRWLLVIPIFPHSPRLALPWHLISRCFFSLDMLLSVSASHTRCSV